MKTWLAGGAHTWTTLVLQNHPYHLISFVYESKGFERFKIVDGENMKPNKLRFFLDSGAFSAWSSGKVIDLDEYCEFIKANIEYIDAYANLDVIPGVKGSPATPQQREEAAQASWDNYLYMCSQGLSPLPVFHCGEDFKWLKLMMDNKIEYIGLGGMVGINKQQRRNWLDKVFTEITDPDGRPKVKVHGFGMTAMPLIFRYPWYSVDSTSWLRSAASGNIYLPYQDEHGEFCFDRIPYTVAVSTGVPVGGDVEDEKVPEIAIKGDKVMGMLNQWLKECGVTFEQVSKDYYYRAIVNVVFFKKVAEKRKNAHFNNRTAIQSSLW
jgi:hypothetical protein